MINFVNGDIMNAKEDIIAHQVNCKGKMGSGVALSIKNKYPNVYDQYKNKCDNVLKSSDLLGTVLIIQGKDSNKYVANIFAQDSYGWNKQYTNIEAFEKCIYYLRSISASLNLAIAMPYKIGCGRGGADWDNIYNIIKKYFDGEENPTLTFYRLSAID